MESVKKSKKVVLILSEDESLVFFEWLTRFNEGDHTLLFNHQSEQRILFDIEALLEKNMSNIFSKDYDVALSKARKVVGD